MADAVLGFQAPWVHRGPRDFEIRAEIPLSDEPPRLDYLLRRKLAAADGAPGHHGGAPRCSPARTGTRMTLEAALTLLGKLRGVGISATLAESAAIPRTQPAAARICREEAADRTLA